MLINPYRFSGGAPPDKFGDDFETPTVNALKWTPGAYDYYNALITATQTGGELHLTPINESGNNHGGLVSTNFFDFEDQQISIELIDFPNQAGTAYPQFGIFASPTAYAFILVYQNTLYFRSVAPGTSDTSIAFNHTNHRFWRMRHDSAADLLHWETSPDNAAWTTQRSVTPPFSLLVSHINITVGTFMAETLLGDAVFDNFSSSFELY